MRVGVFGFRIIDAAVTPGGPPGAIRVGNMPIPKVGDVLINVRHLSADLLTNADLTADFTITDSGVITNGGVVDTSGDFLLVVWAPAS